MVKKYLVIVGSKDLDGLSLIDIDELWPREVQEFQAFEKKDNSMSWLSLDAVVEFTFKLLRCGGLCFQKNVKWSHNNQIGFVWMKHIL